MSYQVMAVVWIFAIVFGVALLISWIVLPVAVFGIKKRLDRIISLMESRRP